MSAYRDENGQPLTIQALIGRRAKRWHPSESAFGLSGVVVEVSTAFAPDTRGANDSVVLAFDDGHRESAPVTEVLVCAVDDRQVLRAAIELRAALGPRLDGLALPDVESCARQVLEAAVQRP